MLGTFLALDLVLFFVFFEVVLLPMYFVIAGWGGDDDRAAARRANKFILYTLFGSVLLLLGLPARARRSRHLRHGRAGARGGRGHATATAGRWRSSLLGVGFAVKAPMWPLHTWLPDAHTEAPTVGSVLLAGVLLKMGTYGLIRIAVPVVPRRRARRSRRASACSPSSASSSARWSAWPSATSSG